jgi:hypothetical protein
MRFSQVATDSHKRGCYACCPADNLPWRGVHEEDPASAACDNDLHRAAARAEDKSLI